jgi:hypothetical protein
MIFPDHNVVSGWDGVRGPAFLFLCFCSCACIFSRHFPDGEIQNSVRAREDILGPKLAAAAAVLEGTA